MEKLQSYFSFLVQFDWISHWKLLVMIPVLIYFIRVICKRDEIMGEAKRGVLTLPGIITTLINDAIVLGIFFVVRSL